MSTCPHPNTAMRRPTFSLRLFVSSSLLLFVSPALAQTQYSLDPASGAWVARPAAAPDPDAAPVAEARRLLADNRPSKAISILDDWIEAHETGDHPLLAQAYLLRGDAVLARGNEFLALYDYEAVCRQFPASEEFVKACERELDIATRYARGLKRKWLGMRLTGAGDIGEELLIRVQERLPGSLMAEKANLELGDYYYRTRDLKEAAVVYEAYLRWFPRSDHANEAKERRIYATIGQFRGPDYDASTLTDARILIEEFSRDDPEAARRSGLSDALLARLDESAAAQILTKACWYLRRSDPASARFVLRRLVKDHPQTSAAAAALTMMAERHWTPAAPKPAEPSTPPSPPDSKP